VLRTKVDCLRVCAEGPIAVVYPDGTWYRGVTATVAERILLEHVLGGRVVHEQVLGSAPLATPPGGTVAGGTVAGKPPRRGGAG
jgi:(2Fe-2S) ferredoxin